VDRRHEEVQDGEVSADQLRLRGIGLAVVVEVLDDVGDDRDLGVSQLLDGVDDAFVERLLRVRDAGSD
jgi:hypothetical protein